MVLLFQQPRKQPTIFTEVFTYASSFLLGNDHFRSQPKIKNICLPINLKIILQSICIGILWVWVFFSKSCYNRLQPSQDRAGCASAAQTYTKRQIVLQRPSHQQQGDGQGLITVLQVKQCLIWIPPAKCPLNWYN